MMDGLKEWAGWAVASLTALVTVGGAVRKDSDQRARAIAKEEDAELLLRIETKIDTLAVQVESVATDVAYLKGANNGWKEGFSADRRVNSEPRLPIIQR